MKSPEAADQIKAINNGLKALGTLRFANDADVMKLIDGFHTKVTDNTVQIRWDASADDVWTVAEKVAKKAAEHMKKGGACPFMKGGKDVCPFTGKAGKCPAGCQCPACKAKAKAEADGKAKAGKCPAGCQCPACKAKAEKEKAKAKDEEKAKPEERRAKDEVY